MLGGVIACVIAAPDLAPARRYPLPRGLRPCAQTDVARGAARSIPRASAAYPVAVKLKTHGLPPPRSTRRVPRDSPPHNSTNQPAATPFGSGEEVALRTGKEGTAHTAVAPAPANHMTSNSPSAERWEGQAWGVERISLGEKAAFEVVFRALGPGLCAFINRYVRSDAVAEELTQDLFLELWTRRSELEITTNLKGYLFVAAKRRALNYLRRERLDDRFRTTLLERPTPSSDEDELLQNLDIQEAISKLPARCRLIFECSRQKGMSHKEIADLLGLSVRTVEVQVGRALRTLRKHLKTATYTG